MLVVLHMVAQPPVFALWDIPQQGQGPYCPRALWRTVPHPCTRIRPWPRSWLGKEAQCSPWQGPHGLLVTVWVTRKGADSLRGSRAGGGHRGMSPTWYPEALTVGLCSISHKPSLNPFLLLGFPNFSLHSS